MNFVSRDQLFSWARKIVTFFLNQGAVQVLSLVTGFLIPRWVSVDAYAQYSVAFGFQSSVGMLIDLGFTGTIIALVGQRVGEPAVVGRYIRSALHYRNVLFLIALPFAAGIFIWITARQHWPWPLRASLYCSIMFTLYFQGWSTYSTPLIMHQRFRPFYRTQFTSAVARLLMTVSAHLLGALNSAVTAWINALSMAISGFLYRARSRDLVDEPRRADPEANREVLRYAAPTMLPVIFSAFEGQITLYLVTWFGHSRNIAEVAALGRLTQVLIVLMSFNNLVVHPYVARLDRARLPGRYVLLAGAGTAVAVGMWAFSVVLPQPLLWVMGPKYAHLTAELPYSVAGWGFFYVSSLLWAMHTGRKWVFWWHTTFYCVAMILAQLVGVWLFDLGSTVGILKFGMLGAAASLFVQIIGGLYGFWIDRHPEQAAQTSPAGTSVDPAAPLEASDESVVAGGSPGMTAAVNEP